MDARGSSDWYDAGLTTNFILRRFPSTSTDSTASNLPGPGRTLGLFYSFIGWHIENQLGQLAEKLGKGPRMTAIRIQSNREKTSSISSADRKKVTKINAKIEKDCRKLLRYVQSQVGSTQIRALDEITCLVLEDRYIQEVLLAVDAKQVVGSLQIWHFRRRSDFSSSLLSSSRKALSSLADIEINSLAKEMEDKMILQREWPHAEFNRFRGYVNEPERAFLVVRHLQRFLDKPISHDYIISHIFKVDGMINFDAVSCSLEWPTLDLLISRYYEFFTRYSTTSWHLPSRSLASLLEFVLRYPDKLPQAINSEFFSWLASFDAADNSIDKFHIYLSWCLLHGIAMANNLHEVLQVNMDLLQDVYPHPAVKAILHRISGLPELLLHSVISARYGRFDRASSEYFVFNIPRVVSSEELEGVCRKLSEVADRKDNWMRERALHAFKYLLSVDIYCRSGSLLALNKTHFSWTAECMQLIEDSNVMCAPVKELRYSYSRQVIRHCDANGKVLHVHMPNFGSHCCDVLEGTKQVLEYKTQDMLELHIARGTAFCTTGHSAVFVGNTTEGKQAYLARPVSKRNHEGDYVAITEGMKPEDLRMLEYRSSGMAQEVVPKYLIVYVLRYTPERYLQCGRLIRTVSDDGFGSNGTCLFSWNPWIATSEEMPLDETVQKPQKDKVIGMTVLGGGDDNGSN